MGWTVSSLHRASVFVLCVGLRWRILSNLQWWQAGMAIPGCDGSIIWVIAVQLHSSTNQDWGAVWASEGQYRDWFFVSPAHTQRAAADYVIWYLARMLTTNTSLCINQQCKGTTECIVGHLNAWNNIFWTFISTELWTFPSQQEKKSIQFLFLHISMKI